MDPDIHQATADIDMKHFHLAGLLALRQHRLDGRLPGFRDLHEDLPPPANVSYSSNDYFRYGPGQNWRSGWDRRVERLQLEDIASWDEFKRGILRGGQRN